MLKTNYYPLGVLDEAALDALMSDEAAKATEHLQRELDFLRSGRIFPGAPGVQSGPVRLDRIPYE